jgi:hypothetical protein
MAWREERTVTASLTLHYNKLMFLLEPSAVSRSAVRQRVVIHDYPDGRLLIRWKGVELPYRVFDKMRSVDQGPSPTTSDSAPRLPIRRRCKPIGPASATSPRAAPPRQRGS